MARTYKRDSNGRFASTGSARSGPKTRMATRGTNRLTRDNSGRITSVGGQGATARGGRLRTASGAKRGSVVARLSLQRGGVIGKPKGLKPGALKGRGRVAARKVDLTDAGFTRRLTRAKSKLSQAEKTFKERGSSIYDKPARNRVMVLRSAVDQLQAARQTVRTNTVDPAQIKARLREGKRDLVANYQSRLQAITKSAARTATGQRRSTAPKLTPAEKAAATRARNKRAKEKEQIKRMENARRYR